MAFLYHSHKQRGSLAPYDWLIGLLVFFKLFGVVVLFLPFLILNVIGLPYKRESQACK